jgi:hypothetical protein
VDWPIREGVTPPALSERAREWLASASGVAVDGPSGLDHHELLAVLANPVTAVDVERNALLFHPTQSCFIDPLVGELAGQGAIRAGLAGQAPKLGGVGVEPVGPLLFDGTTAVQEWVQGSLRGTSVRRFADGWVTYAVDYFDTAALD